MLAARVIGAGASETSRTLYIDRGEKDKIQKNMAVITPDGVVGSGRIIRHPVRLPRREYVFIGPAFLRFAVGHL